MSRSSHHRFSDVDHARLSLLGELASYKTDELLTQLDVRCRRTGKLYLGPCPVHDGDRANGWNFYPDGHTTRGVWYCRTRECHKTFVGDIPGLVRGILSRRDLGWEPGSRKLVPMTEVIQYLCGFVGQSWDSLKADLVAAEKRRFVADMAVLGRAVETRSEGWDPKVARDRLSIPSQYFLKRGCSREVLERYLVGESRATDPGAEMYQRAVVPIFDREGRRVVGGTGRSVWECCARCRLWHNPEEGCPSGATSEARSTKWRHSRGFPVEHTLYNWWAAREPIRTLGRVVLVEGPLDVLKLEMAGVRNSVALFGVNLSDPQQVLLEGSGAHTVIPLLDSDPAGAAGRANLIKELRRSFRVRAVELPGKDPGDMTAEQIRAELIPLIS